MRHHALKALTFIVAVLMLTAFTGVTHAVDGVILIDQNRAMAGGVTPGDAPGFPVEINIAGSYRLSGNLTLPTPVFTGIKINSGNVTIDLNGFSIIGAARPNFANGIAIDGPGVGGITVINGNIFGVDAGIRVGDFAKVEHMRVTSSITGNGIEVGDHAIVRNNVSYGNSLTGIQTGGNSVISGNTVNHNGESGILVTDDGSTVSENTANSNGFSGIQVNLNHGSSTGGRANISGNTAFNNVVGIEGGGTVRGNTCGSNTNVDLFVDCPSIVVGNLGAIAKNGPGCVLVNNAP